MPDSQPENYRKCTPNSCGFCTSGKAPKTIQCSYALTKLNPISSDEIFPENQSCKYNLLEIHALAQSSAKSIPRKRMAVSLAEQIENLVEDFKKRKTEHIDPRFPGVTVFYD